MTVPGQQFNESRQIVLDALAADVGQSLQETVPELASTALAYYRDIAREDIGSREAVDILGAVVSQMEFSALRRDSGDPARPAIRVTTPTIDLDGWTCEHTVVEVVADDEPFIVDSVTAALTQADRTIMLTIHPVISVDGRRESWLHVEIDRESDRQTTEALTAQLRQVLSDVSAAVADWQPMVRKAREIADTLLAGSAELTAAEISATDAEEAAELLRWMADDNFTLLGYREYALEADDSGETALVSVPQTGLGVMRDAPQSRKSFDRLPARVQAKARERRLLVLTKANRRSTVHRPVYLDYVGVKTFNSDGQVNGERRFIGLLTAATYAHSATEIPVARRTVESAIAASGFEPGSHSARDLLHFCEVYPRDELLQVSCDHLLDVARQVIAIGERRQTRVFVRDDDYGRFASLLLYLPRDRYTTDVRIALMRVLADTYQSNQIDYVARVSDSVLARLHFVVRFAHEPEVDLAELNDRMVAVVANWDDELVLALIHEFGEERAMDVLGEFQHAFPDAYKADVPPRAAAADVARLLELGTLGAAVKLHDQLGQSPGEHRFTLYSVGNPVELAELLPVFESLGAAVLEERPYDIRRRDGTQTWIYDVGIRLPGADGAADEADLAERFCSAFLAVWRREAQGDSLNALISRTGLSWREVSWLRSWVAYSRQIGSRYSTPYIEQVLLANNSIAVTLIGMFEARFLPPGVAPTRECGRWEDLDEKCLAAIDAVANLDADRILRQLRDIVHAIIRTNAFQVGRDGQPRRAVAHKLAPRQIRGIPEPAPEFEIWVCSPRLSGVHLRFGKIARGGLRWSDRPEDMRTEILGLVKAQMVKNSVIVPVGAKGGFFVKGAIDSTDRNSWQAQGLACYREFIGSLLELTDNRVGGEVVQPPRTVCLDDADPYLVVAADKGTATFSDTANEIAVAHGFWLGDAFASGGSHGYDHKEMGITARGAWESVKRHFRELNVNVETDTFTVVGIGDMSGDVFGNAMLLSNTLELVAAFDHRHIFLDPNPVSPQTSFEERQRLALLERSSWADYSRDLISTGGGVYSRNLKSIRLTPEVRNRLGIDDSVTELTPNELIHRILLAPVDLLFNGGIGTYVKSTAQSNQDVGDKANDSVRVNGSQLRTRVVGEGGNLGLTQAGRVEASRVGVQLNTDAIDNSAGVDCSDHEVNIKILLDHVVASGDMTVKQRNELLVQMTTGVASLVLVENYRQNLVLMYARAQNADLLPVHRRLIGDLESRGFIDRELEELPSDAVMARMQEQGLGLSSPELCVLLSWVKIALTQDLTGSAVPHEAWFNKFVMNYFPEQIRDQLTDAIAQHPLRTEIIATMVANDLVDCGGITFMHRTCEETGASPVEVVRAYAVSVNVFGLRDIWREISELDDVVPSAAQIALHLEVRRLLDRATRWLLALRGGTVDVAGEIGQFRDAVQSLSAIVDRLLIGQQRQRFQARTSEFVQLGAPAPLAMKVAGMLDRFSLLDIDDLATRHGEAPEGVAELYFAVSEHYGFDGLLVQITNLPRQDRWDNLARAALRSDLYSVLAGLTSKIMRMTDEDEPPESRIASWEEVNWEGQQRGRATLADLAEAGISDLATLSVALRTLRTLVGQTRGDAPT